MRSVPPAARVSGAALFLRYWLPVLVYVGIIFSLSSLQSTGPSLFAWQDKVEHFLEYALFGLLLGRAFRFTIGGTRGRAWFLSAVVLGSLVGALDEIYQRSVPGRISDVRDWATDTAALIAAVLFTQLISARALGAHRAGTRAAAPAAEEGGAEEPGR
jgi:VanZ family protein